MHTREREREYVRERERENMGIRKRGTRELTEKGERVRKDVKREGERWATDDTVWPHATHRVIDWCTHELIQLTKQGGNDWNRQDHLTRGVILCTDVLFGVTMVTVHINPLVGMGLWSIIAFHVKKFC